MQKLHYSFLKVLTGSDLSIRRLPMMEADSGKSGPVVWITACVHGDEVGGMVIIQEIFRRLAREPLLHGALYAFPLINPMGFETISRNITLSREDLNRAFPGNRDGSLAERIANRIFTTIVRTKPTLVLDLHNDWRKSIPYAIMDPFPGIQYRNAFATMKQLARRTGFVVIREPSADFHKDRLESTLSGSMMLRNIPSFTIEVGEAYFVNERDVEYGVRALWNILIFLGMVEHKEKAFVFPAAAGLRSKVLKYSQEPVSSSSGIIRFMVKPGELVSELQPLAKIYNTFGKLQETLHAQSDAIVLGIADSSVAFPGAVVLSLGII